jgi:hypothetical protein
MKQAIQSETTLTNKSTVVQQQYQQQKLQQQKQQQAHGHSSHPRHHSSTIQNREQHRHPSSQRNAAENTNQIIKSITPSSKSSTNTSADQKQEIKNLNPAATTAVSQYSMTTAAVGKIKASADIKQLKIVPRDDKERRHLHHHVSNTKLKRSN